MKLHRYLAALIFVLRAAVVHADFTFVHVSDIHVGASLPAGGPPHAEIDEAMFKEIAALNPKPAFVAATGDICEIGSDDQYETYRDVIRSLGDIALYVAPGNHDVRWNPRGKEGFTRGTKQPLYQSWDYQNVHFVLLDSTVLLEHWGHISQDQLDWLKGDLEKAGTQRPVIIGFHHWVGRDPVMVDNERALFDLVKPYNIVLWLQGHGHANIDWSIDGVPATMVGALYDSTYHILHVTDDGKIEITQRQKKEGKKGKGGELVTDAATQPTMAKSNALFKPIMTIPLKRQPSPQWSADVKLLGEKPADYALAVTAKRGDLPDGTNFNFRLNSESPWPLVAPGGDFNSTVPGKHEPMTLTWGKHTVTVAASLPDKRSYQQALSVTVAGDVKPLWTKNVGGAVQSRLIRNADRIYVSSMGNDFVALNAADGGEAFRVKTKGPIFSAAAIDSGVACFGSADHFVYAVDLKTGDVRWKAETGGAVLAGPAVAQGIVCVGSVDTKIYGIDISSGSIIWTVDGGNMYQSQTATDGKSFFVGGWDNFFRCIDAKSGKENWKIELGRKQAYKNFSQYAPAITSPAVGEGLVFVSTNDGILHGLKIADGSEVWHVNWLRMGYSSPLYHNGNVYCAMSDEGRTFCVDAKTGEMKWIANTGSVIYDSSFALGGDRLFIGCVNGVLNCIKADDGKLLWQYRLGEGHFLGSPAADDKNVFAATMAGDVVCLPIKAKKED